MNGIRAWKRALHAGCLTGLVFITACSGDFVREERYGDGSLKTRSAFIRKSDGALLRHGVRMAWYPSGEKESMETYINGYRQGYSFRWHRNGKLKSLERYTGGIRDDKADILDEAGALAAIRNPDGGLRMAPVPEKASTPDLAAYP
jgi:antitoxin component YwqK of YwqJK toxin-antitoxin module